MLHALYHLLHPCLSWWVTNAVCNEDWLGGLLLLDFLLSKKNELARTHKKTYVDFEGQVSPHLFWQPWALLRWGRAPFSQHSVIPVKKLLPSIITPLQGPCRYCTYSKRGNFSYASMSICQLHILKPGFIQRQIDDSTYPSVGVLPKLKRGSFSRTTHKRYCAFLQKRENESHKTMCTCNYLMLWI